MNSTQKTFTNNRYNKKFIIKCFCALLLFLICLVPLSGYANPSQNFVEVRTFEELKKELEKDTAQTVRIQENILMTGNIKVKTNHTLQIAEDKTLTTDNFQINIPKTKTLTLGESQNEAQGNIIINNTGQTAIYNEGDVINHLRIEIGIPEGSFLSNGVSGIYCGGTFQNEKNSILHLKGSFGQSSGININGSFILDNSRLILENSSGNGLWIEKKENGFSMKNSTLEIKTSSGKPFYFQNAATVEISGESKMILHPNAKFNFPQIVVDRGKKLLPNPATVTTVLNENTLAEENRVTAGEYFWNETHFEKTCEITLDSQGGTLNTDKLKTNSDGKLLSLPVPKKDGFEFKGWYTEPSGGDKIDSETIFHQSATIFAQWEQIPAIEKPDKTTPKENNHSFQSSVRPDSVTSKDVSVPSKEEKKETSRHAFFLQIGSKNYYLQKGTQRFEQTSEAMPFIHNGKTMLPLKTVAEILNFNLEYDAQNKVVQYFVRHHENKKEQPIIEWLLLQKKIRIQENELPIMQDILNIDGRVFVSATDMKLAAQKAGIDLKIQWENKTKQLILSYENHNK